MKQKLLLVDDRPENIFVLESTLEDPALEFVKADCGEEALKQLLRNDISIILLDVQMPGMDGFEAAELIRGNPLTKNIPIIFVSAINQEKKHIFKGYASGAIDYIFKPFDPEILKSKVKILLEIDKQRRIVQQKNNELSFAKRNTDSILENVKEGLFLLDRQYKILPQYSLALECIFDQAGLAETNLKNILKQAISEKTYENLCDFLELCFNESIEALSIADLNPISEIEFHSQNENSQVKYLSTECRRIYNGDEIENLIFTVNDKTEKILLQKKLAKIEEEANKQMDNLFSIIHIDPMLLRDFIESLQHDIRESEISVIQLSKNKKTNTLLEDLYRRMHQIKGNAAVLDLKNFMDQAHKAEDIISQMQQQGKSSEKDIQFFKECLDAFKNRIEEINVIISKLNHIHKYFRPKRTYEVDMLFKAMHNLIENLQKKTGKKAQLIYNNFDGITIPYNCRLNIKDILIQLTRNAFYHGIEDPLERKKFKKDPVAHITIETIRENGLIGFTFKDDGCGIQLEKLRLAAQKSGKWTDKEIRQWNDQQLLESIYAPGVSTFTKVNSGAGRGVGMDIVKDIINKAGGHIQIETEEGNYTLFKIYFPVKTPKNKTAFAETLLN